MSATKTKKPAAKAKALNAEAPAKTAKPKKPKTDAKLSAIDAAAKVLADSREPMNCKSLIEAMAEKGMWKSSGGATPWATVYSTLIREINTKGANARFVKVERGQFTVMK